MASNYGVPPPPPPGPNAAPAASTNDVGSLCPPPPPPAGQYHQQMHQQMHPMAHQHQTMPQQGYYPPPNPHYQQYQSYPPQSYPHAQQPPYNQYSYRGYANYAAAPPPPPPPPPPPQHNHHNFNTNNHARGRNDGQRSNADVAASLRQSLPANPNANNAKPKKVNPKMAKKYAGRGLKTITVSGPGMPTQRFKICVGNHPDDVKKWIEERKKRFPRSSGSGGGDEGKVIEEVKDSAGKKRALEDAEEGEIAPSKRRCHDADSKKDGSSSDEEKPADGLSSLLAGYDSSSSQDEAPDSKRTTYVDSDVKESPSGLGASTEGDTAKPPDTNPQPKRLCKFYQRGKCRHGTSCKFLHSDAAASDERQKRRETQSERDRARNQRERELKVLGLSTRSHGSRYTSGGKVIDNTSLLHKLLQRDKEREHRLTLQLLRYIVDCDYFRGESTTE